MGGGAVLAARITSSAAPPLAPVDDVIVSLSRDGASDVGSIAGGHPRLCESVRV